MLEIINQITDVISTTRVDEAYRALNVSDESNDDTIRASATLADGRACDIVADRQSPDAWFVVATIDGKDAGSAMFEKQRDGKWAAFNVTVRKSVRRLGVSSAMHDILDQRGYSVRPTQAGDFNNSTVAGLTGDGEKFWASRNADERAGQRLPRPNEGTVSQGQQVDDSTWAYSLSIDSGILEFESNGKSYWVTDIRVPEADRRQVIATRLYRALYQMAAQSGGAVVHGAFTEDGKQMSRMIRRVQAEFPEARSITEASARRITPQDIYDTYWLAYLQSYHAHQLSGQYDADTVEHRVADLRETYLRVFKQMIYDQLVKYQMRGRHDADFNTGDISAESDAETLSTLMAKTYRSDMHRRNERWELAASYTAQLEKTTEPRSVLQVLDRLNNVVHNTGEVMLTKLGDGYQLKAAMDFCADAGERQLRDKAARDLRQIGESVAGGEHDSMCSSLSVVPEKLRAKLLNAAGPKYLADLVRRNEDELAKRLYGPESALAGSDDERGYLVCDHAALIMSGALEQRGEPHEIITGDNGDSAHVWVRWNGEDMDPTDQGTFNGVVTSRFDGKKWEMNVEESAKPTGIESGSGQNRDSGVEAPAQMRTPRQPETFNGTASAELARLCATGLSD